MITPKAIFLRNESLAAWWNGVAKGEQYPMVLAMVRAELTRDSTLTPEMLKGVDKFEQLLSTIGERDDTEPFMPSSGLNHNLDVSRNTKPAKQSEKKAA